MLVALKLGPVATAARFQWRERLILRQIQIRGDVGTDASVRQVVGEIDPAAIGFLYDSRLAARVDRCAFGPGHALDPALLRLNELDSPVLVDLKHPADLDVRPEH